MNEQVERIRINNNAVWGVCGGVKQSKLSYNACLLCLGDTCVADTAVLSRATEQWKEHA